MLGTLYYGNVYEYYDEPRFFSASSSVGNKYLCYWLGSDETGDKWLIFGVSAKKLKAIEEKKRCIRDSLLYQEETTSYIFEVAYGDDEPAKFKFFLSKDIEKHIKLPKPGLYISNTPDYEDYSKKLVAQAPPQEKSIEIIKRKNLATPNETSHEIHIDKVSRKSKPLMMNQIIKVLNSFNDFYRSMTDALDINSSMFPSGHREGSFILSLDVEKFEVIENELVELFELVSREADIKPFVKLKGIDTAFLLDLFYSVADSNAVFDLRNNQSGRSIVNLSAAYAKHYINDQEFIHLADSSIRSSQVPQANDLDKLFEVVSKKASGIYITEEEVSLTERQIQYYMHAASTLGFMDAHDTITALGRRIAQADSQTRMIITARCFQLCECVQAWITWAQVKNVIELDPSTATDFLIECCSTLSPSTAKRRASTLNKWYQQLSKYLPEYSENV